MNTARATTSSARHDTLPRAARHDLFQEITAQLAGRRHDDPAACGVAYGAQRPRWNTRLDTGGE